MVIGEVYAEDDRLSDASVIFERLASGQSRRIRGRPGADGRSQANFGVNDSAGDSQEVANLIQLYLSAEGRSRT